ncbi:MAG: hypothetical protein HUK12_06975 [Muribaculaceae bacterium]|nr:hypothetical protein [Muribaculaceae bacterium]
MTDIIPKNEAYAKDRTMSSLSTYKHKLAGITVLAKPANTHHLKGNGSLFSDNAVLQWLQRTTCDVP